MNNDNEQINQYVDQLASQLRKGFLSYCVLKVCAKQPMYTSDIISELSAADLVVVEGTIYPLLSRLRKDGLLEYQWRESEQGPPRKYYQATSYGQDVAAAMDKQINKLNNAIKKL